ncbi:MAG: 30S ribosomal protein S20 [Thermodesulfobacteriota bacterium]|jgi:small subunit ribosomal protein S20|nr:MAG: 30S ribosomal protein S20 [Thermodesulfobacteriota bacterium]
MATHKSALKRSKQSKEKRLRNRNVKSNLKTTMKAVSSAIEAKDPKKAQEVLSQVTPVINKAASKGVIHKKNAARKISRLTRKVNALKS